MSDDPAYEYGNELHAQLAMMKWKPIDTAPEGELVDVLFDPTDTDMPEFYCPSGKVTGLWRLCHMYREGGKWWSSDGLDAMQKRSHCTFGPRLTHWMPLPGLPADRVSRSEGGQG